MKDQHSTLESEGRCRSPESINYFTTCDIIMWRESLFWFDSADSFLFLDGSVFDWKVVRVLMVVGLSSPLSKSSFILFYSWCFCTPKAR